MEEKREIMTLFELLKMIHEQTGTTAEWEIMYILKNGVNTLKSKWEYAWVREMNERIEEEREIEPYEESCKKYFDEYSKISDMIENIELKHIPID